MSKGRYNIFDTDEEGNIIAKGLKDYSLLEGFVSTSSLYTVSANDNIVECTANTFSVTLLTAVGNIGKVVNIKNSGTGLITMETTDSQTIDGCESGEIILNQYDNLQIVSNGTNWIII